MKWTPIALALGLIVLGGVAAPGTAWADHHRCSNFASQAEAQAHYRADPFGGEHNAEGHSLLDDNGDGIACEALPGPYDRVPVSRNAQASAGRAPSPPLPHAGVGDAAPSGTAAVAGAVLLCCAGTALMLRLRRGGQAR